MRGDSKVLSNLTGKNNFKHKQVSRMSKSEAESYEWFSQTIKKLNRLSNRATTAYIENKKRRMFRAGEIIVFKYPNPVTPLKQLKWFDMHPVVLILEARDSNGNLFGVNLHYFPRALKEKFLIWILKKNRSNVKRGKRLQMDYGQVMQYLKPYGLHRIALHAYIKPRIQSAELVSYAQWHHVVELRSEKFVFDGNYTMADILRMASRAT